MKKAFLLFSLTATLISCGVQKEKYLFEKDSDEYRAYQQHLEAKCMEENPKLVKRLEQTNDFSQFFKGNSTETFYKFKRKFEESAVTSTKSVDKESEDKASDGTYYQFVRIKKVTSDQIKVSFSSSLTDEEYQGESQKEAYSFLYTVEDNKAIQRHVLEGVCSRTKGSFGGSINASKVSLQFGHLRTRKTDDDDYIQQEELFVLDTSRPLILHRWNSSTSRKDTDRNKLTKHTAPTVYTLDDVDDCINDENAKEACTKIAQEVKTCNLVINYDLQKSEDPDEFFLETQSGC